jgi:hypothetical protein
MKIFACMLMTASAALSASLYAQDVEDAAEMSGGDVADVAVPQPAAERRYYTLPVCAAVEGRAEVLIPGAKQWTAIETGRHYPLGAMYRTLDAKSELKILFGLDAEVEVVGEATFGTRAQGLGEASRTVTLEAGTIKVKLPLNLPDGLFYVTAPGFKTLNMAGRSLFTYAKASDGDEARVRCVSGVLNIDGPHFKVMSMQAGNEVKIRTSSDRLFSGIYGMRGDYVVRLDQGRFIIKDFETGENRIEDRVLDWKLSPQTVVRIHRQRPALGERLAVTVMTFDAAGQLKNRCAFAEQTYEVNSGEIGPTSKKEREELAKKAREAQDAVGAAEQGAEPAQEAPQEAASEEASEEYEEF